MAGEDKPYRVYKSGRGKGKVPRIGGRRPGSLGRPAAKQPRTRKSTRRRILQGLAIAFCLFVAWVAAWTLASYFSFRDGVNAANARLPVAAKRALVHQDGLLVDTPTTILLLGTDHAAVADRASSHRTDSMMLLRTDPSHDRIYYLSIPRDLYVPIPGHGSDRINAAYQFGGPALTIKTIEALTGPGVKINHIAIVDFNEFKKVIDEIGGITVNVPKPILSNRFDCPFPAAKCQSWQGWRFGKGNQHMNGERALIYTRIRENRLDPGENDLTRAERQQQVIQAVSSKLAGVGTFLDLPFIGGDLMKPLATDLSPGAFIQLGWVRFRSGSVHCRLGGDPTTVGSSAVLQSSEDNRGVISMFTGASAPQPPPPGSNAYQPGCEVGNHPFPH